MVTAAITGHGHAMPAAMDQQRLWTEFFKQHYDNNRVAEKVWQHSGIETRHGVANPIVEDVSGWGTEARMRRFLTEAIPLGKEAAAVALDEAGLDASDIGLFSVVSCTGYATPGLDIILARDLGMSNAVQRLHIGHMGCYAAVPGLAAVSDFVAARSRPALLLCVELTSLHVQPATDELQQMVAHALFSDAAAAVVVEPGGSGLDVVDVVARTDVGTHEHMTWDVTDLGFRMGLSPAVPDILAKHVGAVVDELLSRNGLAVPDVAQWAVHPGGRRILEVVGEQLDLPAGSLDASYDVLREHGNCSSSTVLLVLERLPELSSGQHAVMMAFGPGLTLYAALLRAA